MRIVTSLLVTIVSFLCGIAASAQDVHVGVILPLSGDVALIGDSVKNGILLAHDSLPNDLKKRIKLHFEDDRFQPLATVGALNRLIVNHGAQIIVNFGSATGNAVAPLAESKKLPTITIATDPKVTAGRSYVFNIWVNADAETAVLLPEMKRRGMKKISRIVTIHDASTAMKESFDRQNDGEIKVVADEEYASDAQDFKSYLLKVRAAGNVDAMMAILFPNQLGVFAKQAREMGINVPFVGYELFEDPGAVKSSNGALIGGWYATAEDPDEAFTKEFRKRHPDNAIIGAANGHDAILLIAEAVKRGVPAAELPQFLRNVKDFKGALGTFSSLPDNRFSLPAMLKVVTASGFEKLAPQS